ncbi:hypothetical protein NDU88_007037 [Pleurodeles waltl]|uniref:Uncharacterized protein n=1 Tax=Pleurodeles waltl TaxID=8319 RepID=A0AAV7PMM2_PLEWA|nr:hypothetical protein NDU88_007037 [Pleurodeles waltl]
MCLACRNLEGGDSTHAPGLQRIGSPFLVSPGYTPAHSSRHMIRSVDGATCLLHNSLTRCHFTKRTAKLGRPNPQAQSRRRCEEDAGKGGWHHTAVITAAAR